MSNLMQRAEPAGSGPPRAAGSRTRRPSAERLCRLSQQIASASFDVAVAEIRRPNRSAAPSCEARHAAMYLAHVAFQVSLTAIAREFGRDRTSVGHAIRRIEDRRDEPAFDGKLERVEALARSCLSLLAPGDAE